MVKLSFPNGRENGRLQPVVNSQIDRITRRSRNELEVRIFQLAMSNLSKRRNKPIYRRSLSNKDLMNERGSRPRSKRMVVVLEKSWRLAVKYNETAPLSYPTNNS